MNLRAFDNYLNEIVNGNDALYNHHSKKSERTFLNNGRWALHFLERYFKDKHYNLRRWLNVRSCIFVSDKTGKLIEIDIGRDREALYLFLVFCKKIEEKKEITDDFREHLAIVITRSCTSDECLKGGL